MNNFTKRAIFGSIYVALIVGSILAGKAWFCLLMFVFGIFAAIEIRKTCMPADYPKACAKADMVAIGSALLVPVLAAVAVPFYVARHADLSYWRVFAGSMEKILILIAILAFLIRICMAVVVNHENAFRSLTTFIFSYIYIGLGLMAVSGIYMPSSDYSMILTLFIMLWANDTGAYLVGCTWGRRRLCERLSPKKSWEGFYGGALFTLIAGVICYYALGWDKPIALCIIQALVVIVFGTIGDLLESLIKRSFGVKDSGHLIPGHGGILDRIDSLLLAGPAYFLFLEFIS